jgi:threonine dehydratase
LPTTASAAKLSRLLEQGACVVQHGADCVLAEQEARRIAEERGMVYVSPYNDFEVRMSATAVKQGVARSRCVLQTRCNREGVPPRVQVMAGQGTVAVELLQQLPGGLIDVCIVPVGGGGLIAGIAAVLKASQPGCQVIGVQPTASDVMRQCVAAGRIVDVPCGNTLSDATAGWCGCRRRPVLQPV